MKIEELAAKHQDDFPGYTLADIYEAAFPTYAIHLQVLLEEQRPLPLVEEFVLKAIDAGQDYAQDIGDLLGLELSLIRSALNQLQRLGYIALGPAVQDVRLHLTAKGQKALNDLLFLEPKISNLNVCQDALTGNYFAWRPLRQPQQIKDLGLHEIPSFKMSPKLDSLDLGVLKKLQREAQAENAPKSPRRELVEVLRIEKSWTAYRIMRVLQFVRADDGSIQVMVFDGSESSPSHGSALLEMERLKHRPLRAVRKEEVPTATQEIETIIPSKIREAAKTKAIQVPRLEQEIRAKQEQQVQEKAKLGSQLSEEREEAHHLIEQLNQQIARLQTQIQQYQDQAGATEVLQMHEHRPKLMEAFEVAKNYVILISPWLRHDAIDYELRDKIGAALKRGIDISIGYGMGEDDPRDRSNVERLRRLAAGKRGQLKLYRLGDVHSKVLICDNQFMIISSFNWLSFAGDSTRGSRVEDGILTREQPAIELKTKEWLERFAALKPA